MDETEKRLYEDIGTIKKGIEGLEDQNETLTKKVDQLNGKAVTHDECHARSGKICDKVDKTNNKIDEIKEIMKQEILDTKAEVSQVTCSGPAKENKPWILRAGKYAGAIAAVLALLGMLGGGILMLSRFISQVETSLTTSRRETIERGKRFDRRLKSLDRRYAEPVVVPVPIPMAPSPNRGPHGRR